jgi:hypothetical protein
LGIRNFKGLRLGFQGFEIKDFRGSKVWVSRI